MVVACVLGLGLLGALGLAAYFYTGWADCEKQFVMVRNANIEQSKLLRALNERADKADLALAEAKRDYDMVDGGLTKANDAYLAMLARAQTAEEKIGVALDVLRGATVIKDA